MSINGSGFRCSYIASAPAGRGIQYFVMMSSDGGKTWVMGGSSTDSREVLVEGIDPTKQYIFYMYGKSTGGRGGNSPMMYFPKVQAVQKPKKK